MSRHLAGFACPASGKIHRVATMLQIERGPDRAGTAADLYGHRAPPPAQDPFG